MSSARSITRSDRHTASDGRNSADQDAMSTDQDFLTDQWFLEVYLPSLAAQSGQRPGDPPFPAMDTSAPPGGTTLAAHPLDLSVPPDADLDDLELPDILEGADLADADALLSDLLGPGGALHGQPPYAAAPEQAGQPSNAQQQGLYSAADPAVLGSRVLQARIVPPGVPGASLLPPELATQAEQMPGLPVEQPALPSLLQLPDMGTQQGQALPPLLMPGSPLPSLPAATPGGARGATKGKSSLPEDTSPHQSGGESADGKGKSRYRSEREQALNKLAQVRYRERKKAKVQDLQSEVASLSKRMQALSTAQHRNALLRARNEALMLALGQQAGSLAGQALRLEGSQSANKAELDAAVQPGRTGAAAEDDDEEAAAAAEAPDVAAHQKERLRDLVMLLNDGLRGAWDAAAAPGQLSGSAGAAGNSAGSSGRYERLVVEAVDCFIAVGRREGARRQEDLDLVSFDTVALQAWEAAVAKIGLTLTQLQAVLGVRIEFAGKREAVVRARGALNAEALQVLRAQDAGRPIKRDFLERARHLSSIGGVIKKLRANLREEQRMHSELAGALLLHVLQPVQAARLLVSLWPAPCDAVLLLHSLLRAHCSD